MLRWEIPAQFLHRVLRLARGPPKDTPVAGDSHATCEARRSRRPREFALVAAVLLQAAAVPLPPVVDVRPPVALLLRPHVWPPTDGPHRLGGESPKTVGSIRPRLASPSHLSPSLL